MVSESELSGRNMNNLSRETSRTFRKKKMDYSNTETSNLKQAEQNDYLKHSTI
jgi:hypothetical protein